MAVLQSPDSQCQLSVDRALSIGMTQWVVAWLNPKRLKLYPVALLAAMSLGWIINLLLGRGLFDANGVVIGPDFLAFYTGGRFFLQGWMDQLYDLGAQRLFQAELAAPNTIRGVHPFISPPFSVLLYAPFARLDYLSGLLAWWGAGLLLLIASLQLLRLYFVEPRPSLSRMLLLSFLFFPTFLWIVYGQITALTLFIYTLLFLQLWRGKEFTAGFVLGFLLYKPQLALLLALVLLVKRRWTVLAGGMAAVTLWLLAALWLSPAAALEYWGVMPQLPHLLRSDSYPTWGIHSFFGFTALLFDGFAPQLTMPVATLLTVTGSGFVAWMWHRTPWQTGSRRWSLTMAATLALGLVVSPHLYSYDLMLLLLPLAIVWRHFPQQGRQRPLDQGPLLAWTAALYIATIFSGYLSKGMLSLTAALDLPAMALQLSLFPLLGWVWCVFQKSRSTVGTLPPSS